MGEDLDTALGRYLSPLLERFRWWRAKRYGERPTCEECSRDAHWYVSNEGYSCVMCEGQRTSGGEIGYIRDLEPEDYYAR